MHWTHLENLKKKSQTAATPRPIRSEFVEAGPRRWPALKSSPAHFNVQPGPEPELQAGSQNCSRRLIQTDSFSCDQLVITKQALQKQCLEKHLNNNKHVFKIEINQDLPKLRNWNFNQAERDPDGLAIRAVIGQRRRPRRRGRTLTRREEPVWFSKHLLLMAASIY